MSSKMLAVGVSGSVFDLYLFKLGYIPSYSFITDTVGLW